MGVRLLGRAMLGQLVVVAINYDFVRTVKSYDLTVLTLQLTLQPFDEGCREPESSYSFLCKEFNRKFWRQRAAFD